MLGALKKATDRNQWLFHYWWAHQDLNLGPKDSGLCSFHYSLDFAFTIACAVGGCRQVSTPSRRFLTQTTNSSVGVQKFSALES